MTVQVSSSARVAERQRTAAARTVVCVFVLVCALSENPGAQAHPQAKPSVETRKRTRFQVTDSVNALPIPDAAVSLIYWQDKASTAEKKEIEVKTDRNGLAEFPKVKADKLAVSVTAKGYRSWWRWMQANSSEELTRIRL